MCGRSYQSYTPEELEMRYIWEKSKRAPLKSPALAAYKKSYNFAPTMMSPVIVVRDGERVIEIMRWGLVPPTEPEFKTKLFTINARSETAATSRLYAGPMRKHRCIWPVSGFYEWKKDGDKKRPFAIRLKNEPIMSVAGVFERWHPGTSEEQLSFSVLTMPANQFMSDVHDRMPLILSKDAEEAWLDPSVIEPGAIMVAARWVPEADLEKFEVSTLVNSVKNDRPELLQPIG